MQINFCSLNRKYERNGLESLEFVLNQVGTRFTSLRYRTFARSLTCVSCGITGLYFARERCVKVKFILVPKTGRHRFEITTMPERRWHYNLYALDADGNEVLMTRDHIIPKVLGGPEALWNMQTMCKTCNEKKGCSLERVRLSLQHTIHSTVRDDEERPREQGRAEAHARQSRGQYQWTEADIEGRSDVPDIRSHILSEIDREVQSLLYARQTSVA